MQYASTDVSYHATTTEEFHTLGGRFPEGKYWSANTDGDGRLVVGFQLVIKMGENKVALHWFAAYPSQVVHLDPKNEVPA